MREADEGVSVSHCGFFALRRVIEAGSIPTRRANSAWLRYCKGAWVSAKWKAKHQNKASSLGVALSGIVTITIIIRHVGFGGLVLLDIE